MTDLSNLSNQELLARYQASRPVSALSDQQLIVLHQRQQHTQRLEKLKRENPTEYDPASKEYQARYGAVGGTSGYDQFMAGAGKSVADVGRGLRQLSTEIGSAVGLGSVLPASFSDEEIARQRAAQTEVNARDAALMQSGAGVAGNVSGTLATTLLPAGMVGSVGRGTVAGNAARAFVNPQTYRAAAAAGATQGALQPIATGESRALNTAVGAGAGIAGQAVARGVSRFAEPVKNALTPQASRAVQTLEREGVPLDLAQRTGSNFAARMKNMLQDNPTTAGQIEAFKETQQRAYNSAVLRTIGESGESATPDVLARANARIGQVFDDIANRNTIRYDKVLEMKLAAIERAARNELDDAQFGVVRRQLDTLLDKATMNVDQIDGKAYQNFKTGLDRISQGQDQSKGYFARQIREALDDALERSASPEDVAALRMARTMYRRLKQIEGAVATDESGHISASKLANSIATKKNAAQAKLGRGDQTLVRLAKAGKQVLPEPTANSGTPARLLAQFALPGALGVAGGLASDDPMTGVKLATATYVLPKLAARTIQPGPISNYLAHGMGNPYVRSALMAPTNQTTVGAITKQAPAALMLAAPK